MERLTGKQAQNMMEALASVYDKSEESQISEDAFDPNFLDKKRKEQDRGNNQQAPTTPSVKDSDKNIDTKRPGTTSSGGGKSMQPANSGSGSMTAKTDKPLATLNRGKKGDGFLGPTISAGGYRMGIPNPIRKEEVEQVSEAGGPALPGEPGRPGTPKAPGGRPHLPGEKQTPKPKGTPGLRLAGADLFDIVKGHLIDEGLTEEEALKKMLTLTDEERSEIIEGSCGSKKDKKKKGGYGK